MTGATFHVGDVFDVLRSMPADSVDLVLTSPPFLALRSYLPDDHADKGREIGQENTPGEFLGTMLRLTAELDRVLAPHGSLCVELGDSYSGSSASGTDQQGSSRYPNGRGMDGATVNKSGDDWPLAKSLCGIPELYAFSLAYGRNLLTGEESPAGMWRVRNLVRWVRPNPPVGALGDKFRPATSTMTVACRAKDRWFDLDAVRDKSKKPNLTPRAGKKQIADPSRNTADEGYGDNPAGAPPLDWWEVPTQPYRGAHYATWPAALCVRPIESMCPREVCRTCGEPRRRLVEVDGLSGHDFLAAGVANKRATGLQGKRPPMPDITRTTLGWTDCGHDDYRRGVVLDPFAGSGTTLAVAIGHGRDAVGIDIDERNADLARERVGMFLEVEQ